MLFNVSGPPVITLRNGGNEVNETKTAGEKVRRQIY